MVWRNGKVVKVLERLGTGKNGDRHDRRSDELMRFSMTSLFSRRLPPSFMILSSYKLTIQSIGSVR